MYSAMNPAGFPAAVPAAVPVSADAMMRVLLGSCVQARRAESRNGKSERTVACHSRTDHSPPFDTSTLTITSQGQSFD